jgi:hypothetical protein
MSQRAVAEERLPAEILALGSCRGNEWAWPVEHVPAAIAAARGLGLATLGGQIQFRCPEGTCELYWLSADSSPRLAGEPWADYVTRSADEVLAGFHRLPANVAALDPEIRRWSVLAEQLRGCADPDRLLCFQLSFVEEGDPSLDAL